MICIQLFTAYMYTEATNIIYFHAHTGDGALFSFITGTRYLPNDYILDLALRCSYYMLYPYGTPYRLIIQLRIITTNN